MKNKIILFLMFISINIFSVSLPTESYEGWYNTEIEQSPSMDVSYNLWELSYSTSNLNGDFLFGFIPINDRLYNGSFYEGDEIHYNSGNPSQYYNLTGTTINGWLTYDMRDTNNDGVVNGSEMNLVANRFFEQGDDVPLEDNEMDILILLVLIGSYCYFKYKN